MQKSNQNQNSHSCRFVDDKNIIYIYIQKWAISARKMMISLKMTEVNVK